MSQDLSVPGLEMDSIENHEKIVIKKLQIGVPTVAQRKLIQLVPMKMGVQSLALLSGLRIWHCHVMWWRLQTRLGSGVAVAVV